MKVSELYKNYLIPAAVFQGVIIGGGYATGREIVEYVTQWGPLAGLMSLFTIVVVFGITISVSFFISKKFQVYDYRLFLKKLLGGYWVIYEVLFSMLLIVVIAVIASAATETAKQVVEIPASWLLGLIGLVIVGCCFLGRNFIQKTLLIWTLGVMFALMLILAFVLNTNYENILANLSSANGVNNDYKGAVISGLKFAVYNSALLPVLVYCAREIDNPKSAIKSGLFTGLLGTIPAIFLHITFLSYYPDITTESVPTFWLLGALTLESYTEFYVALLFGTLVLTAVGILHGVNERINGWLLDKNKNRLSALGGACVTGTLIILSLLLSNLGIVNLVAKGYGSLAFGFFMIFTIPIFFQGFKLLWGYFNE